MKKELNQLEELGMAIAKHFDDSRLTTMCVIIQNMAFRADDKKSKRDEFDTMLNILKLNAEYRTDCHTSQWLYSEALLTIDEHFMMQDYDEMSDNDLEREYFEAKEESVNSLKKYYIYHCSGPMAFREIIQQPRDYAGSVLATRVGEAFSKTNNLSDKNWNVQNPKRSTSVGDIIMEENPNNDDKFYMVKGIGFEELDAATAYTLGILQPKRRILHEDIF